MVARPRSRDSATLDVGLYPLPTNKWTAGKSGLKAIHYMMSGVPAVVSPVGVCATFGRPGETHLTASTHEEWLEALRQLATDERRCACGWAAQDGDSLSICTPSIVKPTNSRR